MGEEEDVDVGADDLVGADLFENSFPTIEWYNFKLAILETMNLETSISIIWNNCIDTLSLCNPVSQEES